MSGRAGAGEMVGAAFKVGTGFILRLIGSAEGAQVGTNSEYLITVQTSNYFSCLRAEDFTFIHILALHWKDVV